MNFKNYFENNGPILAVLLIVIFLLALYLIGGAGAKNNIKNIKTSDEFRIWFDLEDPNNPNGAVSTGVGGETNISVSEDGNPIASFEDKENGGKIRVKIFKQNKWLDLADEKNPMGLISQGKGGNPATVGFGGNIYAAFMEYDNGGRARVRMWDGKQNKWLDLADENHSGGFLTMFRGHEPVLAEGKNGNLLALFAELDREKKKEEPADSLLMKIKVLQWDGKRWSEFGGESNHIGAEIDGVFSEEQGRLFVVFEDRSKTDSNRIRTLSVGEDGWQEIGGNSGILEEKLGFSPAVDMDKDGNLYITYTEGKPGRMAVWRLGENEGGWVKISDNFNEDGEVIESSVAATGKGIFVAYSEYVKNSTFLKKISGKSEYRLENSDGWKVRVKRWISGEWVDVSDIFCENGYITVSNGKGDPSLAVFGGSLYVSISDRELKSKARIKMCDLDKI